ATAIFLALKLDKPLFIECEAGVGKTEAAKVMAEVLDARLIRLQCYEGIDLAHAVYEWNYPRQLLHIRLLDETQDRRAAEREIFSPEFLLRRPLLDAIDNNDPVPPVLLIDEIDRSDEEFEAFLLELLSDFQISIPELGTITAKRPPFVVITSNRTREVHDALKRRCLYHWIDYPDLEKEVSIVEARVPEAAAGLARQAALLLHDAGLDAGPGRLKDATVALNHIDLGSELDFREALRTVFVTRKDELPLFDAAFDIYWAPPDPRILAGSIPGRSRSLPMAPERAKAWLKELGLPQSELARQDERSVTASSSGYSAEELLRQKSFDQLTWQESEQVRRLLAQAPWRMAEKRTRRLTPARGGAIDLRRTSRQAVRSSGELVRLL